MTSRLRAAQLGLALVAGMCAVAFGITAPAASAVPTVPKAPAAVADFASCLNGQHKGDLLLLIDQSGSLQQSDPQAARVTASQYLVRSLAPQLEKAKINLSVAVAGFDATYHQVQGWTSLLGGGTTRLTTAIAKLRSRNTGFETDYWTAIDAARKMLAQRAAGGPRCQGIIFFTDGELAISARDTADKRTRYGTRKAYYDHTIVSSGDAKAADRAASQDLCRPAGLMNALRADGVKTFAVGLSAAGQQPNFGLLQRMATGRGGGQSCGQITSPSPGTFQPATDIDSLLFDFDEFLGPSIQSAEPVCQGRVNCAPHRFVLDNSIGAVHILAASPVNNVTIELKAPGRAKAIDLTYNGPAVHKVGSGRAINYSWPDRQTIVIDLVKPPPTSGQPWTGEWSLIFVDTTRRSPNAISRSNIHISGDIVPVWPKSGTTHVHSDEIAKGIVLGLADSAGHAVPPSSLLGQASLSVVLVDAQGQVVKRSARDFRKTEIGKSFNIDFSGVPPGPAALRLTLDITTKAPLGGTGTKLAPATVDVPLNVLPPFNFPKLDRRLVFGTITGATHRPGHLTVTGPGCVWVPSGTALQVDGAPTEVGTLAVTSKSSSRDSCLKIPAGKTAHLAVTLTNQYQGKGDLTASLAVSTAPLNAGGAPIAVTVKVTGTFKHVISGTKFIVALLVALLLGLGLPALMVFIQKRVESRIPPGTLAFERFPVQVSSGSVTRNGSPLTLQDTDFVHKRVEVLSGTRAVPVDDVLLRARSTPTPGAPPYVLATTAGRVMASSEPVHPSTKDLNGRLPLNVRNNWVVLHDPAGPADQAELLLLVGADVTRDGRTKLLQDAVDRVPRVLASLRQQAEQDGAALSRHDVPLAAHDPWGSSAPNAAQPSPWESGPSGEWGQQQGQLAQPSGEAAQRRDSHREPNAPEPEVPQSPQSQPKQPSAPPSPPPANDDPWGFGGSR